MKSYPAAPEYSAISDQVQSFPNINRSSMLIRSTRPRTTHPLGAFARSQFLRYPRQTLHLTIDEIRMVLTLDIHRAVCGSVPSRAPTIPICPIPC